MKCSYLWLTLALAFCTLECTSAQNQGSNRFQLPDEVITNYLNVSVPDLERRCDQVGNCLGDKIRVIQEVRQNAGQRMVDHIANIMSERPSVNDHDWNQVILHRCRKNIPLDILISLNVQIAEACSPGSMHVTPNTVNSFRTAWINEFCDRVARLAMERYQQIRNRH